MIIDIDFGPMTDQQVVALAKLATDQATKRLVKKLPLSRFATQFPIKEMQCIAWRGALIRDIYGSAESFTKVVGPIINEFGFSLVDFRDIKENDTIALLVEVNKEF